MRALIQRVFSLNDNYRKGYALEMQVLEPPASNSTIRAFEQEIGLELPHSYREFLSLHDGWKGWNGDERLLSIAEMTQGPFADSISRMKFELEEYTPEHVSNGLFISSLLNKLSGLVLNTDEKDDRGEMPIILWEHEEIARFTDFYDLLEKTALKLERLLKQV